MISLLPPDITEARRYGRKNLALLRWIFACLIGFTFILIIGGVGFFFVNNAEVSAKNIKSQVETSIADAKLDEAEKEYMEFSNNLKTVVQILSKQILFSKLIQQVGSITPAGATLNSISLSDADNALDLTFTVDSAAIAPTIQVNLEDPDNELFEKADIIQVACQKTATGAETCTVQLRALIKQDANFLFLNSVEKGSQ